MLEEGCLRLARAADKNKCKKEQKSTIIIFCEEDLLPEELRKEHERLFTGEDSKNPFV